MTSPVEITPEMLAQGATDAHTTADEIEAKLLGLRGYVSDILALWLGVTSRAYMELMENYDTYGKMLDDALNGIGDGLQGNFHNYVTTEDVNNQQITEIDLANAGTFANLD